MNTVFQYEIPVWHPLVVHFPTSLLLAALLAALVWMAWGRAFWRRVTLLLLFLGFVGAGAAYLTGEEMEEQSEGVPIVDQLVELHETMALYTLLTSGAAVLFVGGASVWLERRTTIERSPPDPLLLRLLCGLTVLAAAAFVAWTAHIGGTMVWGVPI